MTCRTVAVNRLEQVGHFQIVFVSSIVMLITFFDILRPNFRPCVFIVIAVSLKIRLVNFNQFIVHRSISKECSGARCSFTLIITIPHNWQAGHILIIIYFTIHILPILPSQPKYSKFTKLPILTASPHPR